VLIIIVFLILQIHVVDLFVLFMKISGELNAVCVTVTTKRFLEHRHVNDIKESGINMFRIIVVTAFRGLEECYNDQENSYLGTQLLRSIYSLMMNLLLKFQEQIILDHLGFTV